MNTFTITPEASQFLKEEFKKAQAEPWIRVGIYQSEETSLIHELSSIEPDEYLDDEDDLLDIDGIKVVTSKSIAHFFEGVKLGLFHTEEGAVFFFSKVDDNGYA